MHDTGPSHTRFIARQPIFNRDKTVAGYELLFRSTAENVFTSNDGDHASKACLDTAVLVGFDTLSSGRSVFVNCTRDSILNGYLTLFSPELTVLEILETVTPDAEVVAACRELKKAGYRIALDDFVDDPGYAPLVDLADIIKVDFVSSTPAMRQALVGKFARKPILLLAEKIETHEEFSAAVQLGFNLFQGYFFCKPVVLSTRDVASSRASYLRILKAANAPELDFGNIEQLIKSEPALYYRLLRYLNSVAFVFRGEIRSITQALVLLGERGLRRWLMLVCAVLASNGKPLVLVSFALVRARFCELLARSSRGSESASFMLGLFSLMDAILDTTKEFVVEQVSLPSEVEAALLGTPNALRTVYELVVAFEFGEWSACEELINRMHIPGDAVNQAYAEAVTWVQELQLS